jgi:thioredoxin 1
LNIELLESRPACAAIEPVVSPTDGNGEEIMAGTNTLELTDTNFENEVLKSDMPVLVDFWAEWCMPCKALGPTIDELATEYSGRVKVGKLNTENNQSTPVKYNIQAIPTILLFKGGEVVQKFVGLTSKKDFQAALTGAAK